MPNDPRSDGGVLPQISRLDGRELEVLRVVGEGQNKIVYEVRDPEHPDETFVVLVPRHQSGPAYDSDSDAIALLEQTLHGFLSAEEIDPERIVRTCDQIINLNPRHQLARVNRGVMHASMGHLEAATADLEVATELGPVDAFAWLQLGVVAHRSGDPRRAGEAAERAALLDRGLVASVLKSDPALREQMNGLLAHLWSSATAELPALQAACVEAGDAPSLKTWADADRGSRKHRWQPEEIQLPERPLLPLGTELSITERSLPSAHLVAFSAGYLLAVMHADGFVHGDFHPGNFRFSLEAGWTAPLDPSGGEPDQFSAVHAAYDFVAPSLTLERTNLSALLLGYGKALSVRAYSAAWVPEEVFTLLGADVDYAVRVDPEPHAALRLRECLDLEVTGEPPAVRVHARDTEGLAQLLSRQPRWAGSLALATTILNYDAAGLWRQQADRLDPLSAVGVFASWVASGYHGAYPFARPTQSEAGLVMAGVVLGSLADSARAPGSVRTPSGDWPAGRAEAGTLLADWLGSFLEQVDTDGLVRTHAVTDDALELVDVIALGWDQASGERWLSQTAARVAQKLLAALVWDPLLDERRELAMGARHSQLSWLTSPTQRHRFDRGDTTAVYLLDRIATLTRLFARTIPQRAGREPIAETGIQWSLGWRGLGLTREILSFRLDGSTQVDDTALLISARLIHLHSELLRHYLMALITAFDGQLMVEAHPFAPGFAALNREYEAVRLALNNLQSPDQTTGANALGDRLRNAKHRGFMFDTWLDTLRGDA